MLSSAFSTTNVKNAAPTVGCARSLKTSRASRTAMDVLPTPESPSSTVLTLTFPIWVRTAMSSRSGRPCTDVLAQVGRRPWLTVAAGSELSVQGMKLHIAPSPYSFELESWSCSLSLCLVL